MSCNDIIISFLEDIAQDANWEESFQFPESILNEVKTGTTTDNDQEHCNRVPIPGIIIWYWCWLSAYDVPYLAMISSLNPSFSPYFVLPSLWCSMPYCSPSFLLFFPYILFCSFFLISFSSSWLYFPSVNRLLSWSFPCNSSKWSGSLWTKSWE